MGVVIVARYPVDVSKDDPNRRGFEGMSRFQSQRSQRSQRRRGNEKGPAEQAKGIRGGRRVVSTKSKLESHWVWPGHLDHDNDHEDGKMIQSPQRKRMVKGSLEEEKKNQKEKRETNG